MWFALTLALVLVGLGINGYKALTRPSGHGCVLPTGDIEEVVKGGALEAVRGPTGFNGHQLWYYANSDGATWLSDMKPSDPDAGGLLLPLDSLAASTSKVDLVDPGAPILSGASDGDPLAAKARACAA